MWIWLNSEHQDYYIKNTWITLSNGVDLFEMNKTLNREGIEGKIP